MVIKMFDMDDVRNIFKRRTPETYLSVIEGKQGIQTYINPLIKQFNQAYKKQLITFLEGVITELKGKEKS